MSVSAGTTGPGFQNSGTPAHSTAASTLEKNLTPPEGSLQRRANPVRLASAKDFSHHLADRLLPRYRHGSAIFADRRSFATTRPDSLAASLSGGHERSHPLAVEL